MQFGVWSCLPLNSKLQTAFSDSKPQTPNSITDSKLQTPNFNYLRPTMTEKILILDFGSQYTQLIARAVREAKVFCEIIPYHKHFTIDPGLKGVILSGSPFSVNDLNAPQTAVRLLAEKLPVLGICYGAQLTAKVFG